MRERPAADPNTNVLTFPDQPWKSAADLAREKFPPIKWVVPGIICEGVTLLGGKPKRGKSWLMLGTALATACGGLALGSIPVEQGDVLGLFLEDNERRLQSRLMQIEPSMRWPKSFSYATEWPRLNEGGLDRIEAWRERAEAQARHRRYSPERPGEGGSPQYSVCRRLRGVKRLAKVCDEAPVGDRRCRSLPEGEIR